MPTTGPAQAPLDRVRAWLDDEGNVDAYRTVDGHWIAVCTRAAPADGAEASLVIPLAVADVEALRALDQYVETLNVEEPEPADAVPGWYWAIFAPRRCLHCKEPLERDTISVRHNEQGALRLECSHCHASLRSNLRIEPR